jgi:hypothetical protein
LVIIGTWLGDRIAYRLNPRMFGTLIGGLVLFAGLILFVK